MYPADPTPNKHLGSHELKKKIDHKRNAYTFTRQRLFSRSAYTPTTRVIKQPQAYTGTESKFAFVAVKPIYI